MQPEADQVLPAPLEAPKDSHQDAGKGKEIEALKGKDKGQDKKKNSSNPIKKSLRYCCLSARPNCWPRGPQDEGLG